jgi:hypothetical protein
MKKLGVIALLFFASLICFAQTDGVVHVKAFPGPDVGTMTGNAMGTCPASSPCILVVDASLAAWPAGTMPTLCANCTLWDFRAGAPAFTNMPNVTYHGIAQPASNAVTATATGSGVLNAQYAYQVYYQTAAGGGYLLGGATSNVTPSNQQVALTNIPVSSDPTVNARVICRTNLTVSGAAYPALILATIGDNVTTSYTDNMPDASLTAYCPYEAAGFGTITVSNLNGGNPIFEIGATALFLGVNSSAGYASTAVGGNNMPACAGCYRNAFFGLDAGLSVTTGGAITGVGVHACDGVTSGGSDFCGGYASGEGITSGTNDVAIAGGSAGNAGSSSFLIAIGGNSFFTGTAISGNVGVGYETGEYCLGVGLTAVGEYALGCGTSGATGNFSSAFGQGSLASETSGSSNTGSGYNSGNKDTTGGSNTWDGSSAGYSNIAGNNSFGGGANALYNSTASNQAAIGMNSCFNITTGGNLLCAGFEAGEFISGGSTANQTSGHSIYLGALTEALANGDTDEDVVGDSAVGHGSHTFTAGASTVTATYFYGTLYDGSTAGVTCSGTPTSSFAATGGLVTHC